MDKICLLLCDIKALTKMKQRTAICSTNLKLITNGVDECAFIDSVELQKAKCVSEIKCMKALVWDSMYADNDSILVDGNYLSSVDRKQRETRDEIKDIRNKELILKELNRKVQNLEELCDSVRDLIIEISDFLRRDDQYCGGETYAIIPNICNLPKNIPIMSAKGKPTFHLQRTLAKIEDFLLEVVHDKQTELIEEKSKHFDEIFGCVD
tara:strand:- start:8751 stop:9377 length:627 start_codon:yes stop_codon:yes gene_type:complete